MNNIRQKLLDRVGGDGYYQWLIFIIFVIKWVLGGMMLFSINFIYQIPEFICTTQELSHGKSCYQFVCQHENQQFWIQHMKKPLPQSISLNYGFIMVCSQQWISSVLQSIGYFGSFCGYFIISYLADNFGRKNFQMLSWLITILGCTILTLSINLQMVAIGSFFMGLGCNSTITLHYTFIKEAVTGSLKSRMVISLQIAFSIGLFIIALLLMIFKDWKLIFVIAIIVPSILIAIVSIKIQQPIILLLKKGKQQQLLKSINRIANLNNKDKLTIIQIKQIISQKFNNIINKVNLLDLFKYKSLRQKTICCGIINLVIQFIYDGSILSFDKFGINIYWDQIMVGLIEAIAAATASFIIPKFKRKYFTLISLAMCGTLTTIIGIQSMSYNHSSNDVNWHTILEMVLLAALRFIINICWGVFFVFVLELFPTEVTSLSFGWISSTGTIGATCSPFIRLLTANYSMFLMSIVSLLAIIPVWRLPQTKDKPIIDIIKTQQQNQQNLSTSILSIENQIQ